jgi:hypothetical protein
MQAVNYLHSGKALDTWPDLFPEGNERVTKRDFLTRLGSASTSAPELERFVRGQLRWYKKKVTFDDLRRLLSESAQWREQFRALGCRGFSYELDLTMSGYDSRYPPHFRLGHEANLRIALLTGSELFYPVRVKSYFRYKWNNHYFHKRMPSIAFCFGRKIDRAWYVVVMQSDLASKGPSYIRDHFRGWRKILFANVVAQARGKVDALYLCRAEDAERACIPARNASGRRTESWMRIYDLTAEQWGMRLVKVQEPVNVQIYHRRAPILSQYFYELPLNEPKEVFSVGPRP